MKDFVLAHWQLIGLIAAYVGIAFVECLPEPGDPRSVSAKTYDTIYRVLHVLANKAIEKNPKLAPPSSPNP